MTEREDDVDTARMEPVRWLDPVSSRDELPPGAGLQDGCLCYVQKDESVWQVRGGEWTQVEKRADK